MTKATKNFRTFTTATLSAVALAALAACSPSANNQASELAPITSVIEGTVTDGLGVTTAAAQDAALADSTSADLARVGAASRGVDRSQLPTAVSTSVADAVLLQEASSAQADAPELAQFAAATQNAENGQLPDEALCALSTYSYHRLRCDAAAQFERLNEAFKAEFGTDIVVSDSYRSLEAQIRAKENKPVLAAVPGTSNHGWGLAVDLESSIDSGYSTAEYQWMYENAPKFGWVNPDWARPGGQKEEPWHWEFVGEYAPVN